MFAQLLVLSTLPMLAGMGSLWLGLFLVPEPPQAVVQPASVAPAAPVSEDAHGATAPASPAVALEPAFALVFELDGAPYLHLHDMDAIYVGDDTGEDADADEARFMAGLQPERGPLPPHAAPALVRMDGFPVAAVAAVNAQDLPAPVAAWQGREVVVDSACRARVTGFALVARVYSEGLAYDETEQHLSPAAVARTIFDDMGHMVLAATLDGCTGSYAQPAERAVAQAANVLVDHPAAAAAVRALRRSEPARAAQRMWRENGYQGNWWQDAEMTTQVVQHPRTGETFISVHALADTECGGLEINLWGMYRVTADLAHPLALEPLTERKLDDVSALQTFVDIDGDGRFEILASSLWGADTLRLSADGSRKAMLHVRYLDCQC